MTAAESNFGRQATTDGKGLSEEVHGFAVRQPIIRSEAQSSDQPASHAALESSRPATPQ